MAMEMKEELDQLQQGMYRYQRIEKMLVKLHQQLELQQRKAQIYEEELEKEQVDIERISKMNVVSIFYKILGSREKQMEKERQEALAAQLKYDAIKKQIEDTHYRISKLETEKMKFADCEKDYNHLYQTKYRLLKDSENTNGEKIIQLEKNISLYKSNVKEIKEAIAAGDSVIDKLLNMESNLDNAEGWGIWDKVGNGILSDLKKHSHIDDATKEATDVQSLLNFFRTELTDVKVSTKLSTEIDGFVKFSDFFFEGLITDWVLESSIEDSIESVRKVMEEVNNVLIKLHEMRDLEEDNIDHLEKELEEVIEQS